MTAICPSCNQESSFAPHAGYSGDGWNEPRVWEEWLVCTLCGDSVGYEDLDAINGPADAPAAPESQETAS